MEEALGRITGDQDFPAVSPLEKQLPARHLKASFQLPPLSPAVAGDALLRDNFLHMQRKEKLPRGGFISSRDPERT